MSEHTYRAFVVHTPVDEAWADTIRLGLENTRVPWRLAGRETPAGRVPATLVPLFRFTAEPSPADFFDFLQADDELEPDDAPAAADESAETEPKAQGTADAKAGSTADAEAVRPLVPDAVGAALADSQSLIVLCSPEGADNPQLDEIVRRFKALGRGARIVPVIVAGGPLTVWTDCCPPALKFRLDDAGRITDQPDPAAPAPIDARVDEPDGLVAEIAARLTGLAPDDFLKPAARAQKLRRGVADLAAGAAVLALLAGGIWGLGRFVLPNTPTTLDALLSAGTGVTVRVMEGADRLGLSHATIGAVASPAERTLQTLAENGAASPRIRYRRAAMLLAFERRAEALGLYARSGDRTAAAAGLLEDLARHADDLDPALLRDVAMETLTLARQRRAHGETEAALVEARRALALLERLASRTPDDTGRRRDVSAAQVAVGDALLAAGEPDAALVPYRDALVIREAIATVDPASGAAKRDVALAEERIGDALVAKHDPAEAEKSFRRALALRLAAAGPDPGWQRALAVVYDQLGDVQAAQGATADALDSHRAALAVQLAAAGHADPVAQDALAVTQERIGDVEKRRGRLAEALAAYQDCLVIRENLAASVAPADPRGKRWRRELAVTHERIGDVLAAQGMPEMALAAYRTSLAGRERLAQVEPSDRLLRDIAVAETRIADVLAELGEPDQAMAGYRRALALRDRLIAAAAASAASAGRISDTPDRAAADDIATGSIATASADPAARFAPDFSARAASAPAAVGGDVWERVVVEWRLAGLGDRPAERFATIVRSLQDLDAAHRLTVEQARWLPLAEQALERAGGRHEAAERP